MIHQYVLASAVACQDVCDKILERGDAVQPKGSSVRDVADIVGW
jgi:hypothetical protein